MVGKIPVRRDDALAVYTQLLEGNRSLLRKEFYDWHAEHFEDDGSPGGVLELHRIKLEIDRPVQEFYLRWDDNRCANCGKRTYDHVEWCITQREDWCTCNSSWDLGWESIPAPQSKEARSCNIA